MKNKIAYIIIFVLSASSLLSCKKKFLEDMKSYDKYDESAFTNEVLTGYYIDRLYNYFFVNYRSPTQAETTLGSFDDSKTRLTEEIGANGTVNNYINPNKNMQLATEADAYYGGALTASIANTPYTRIRLANSLIEKIDGVGKSMSQSFRNTAKGQMYYFRALQYFYLVRAYGGIPLVLSSQQASSTDESIRIPRSTASECFAQIAKDFDSAAALLPVKWAVASTDYGRFTSAAALAMKSRVLLTAASPLFNTDWDNSGSAKWQAALDAGLKAEVALTAAGYGLYGTTAKQWGEMSYVNDNVSGGGNKEAIFAILLSTNTTSSAGYNSSWENTIRPKDHNGGGGISVPKAMLDLFPLANGARPTAANGYVDTFFFENRDPRFYRTFAFSGEKWGIKTNANKVSFFYRWRPSATGTAGYSGNNQTTSPAVVRKMSNPAADTTALAFSGTDIFEYRYAELLLNIAECYAAKGDIGNCINYLGKIRARVGIPSANNYGIGTLADKYAAIEACLYERRVELAYEGKRFWDIQRWLLYDGVSSGNPSANTCTKLGLAPINGTNRTGYYWQCITFSPTATDPVPAAEKNILIDPDASTATFNTEIAKLKTLYKNRFVMTPLDQALDRDGSTPVNILFRPNYYLSGLSSTVLSLNPWLLQTVGWMDYSGVPGTFNSAQ
ncbi:MAG: RagB/SusD family nutrient uptake outer membrane protein [Bacteroidetes bacterium]|nr:MAG: RagB/SusD family nutrient uptake outer membrane protein [Bacteroidota bacterium]